MWMDGDTEAHAVRGKALQQPARGAAAAPRDAAGATAGSCSRSGAAPASGKA